MNRKQKVIRNSFYGIVYQTIAVVIVFLTRKYYLEIIGIELVGYTSLFEETLNFLTIGDLGISAALGISLYRPLEAKNYKTVTAVYGVLKKFNAFLGIGMLLIGLGMTAFLKYINKDIPQSELGYVKTVFILMLMTSIISYFFSAQHILLFAAQEQQVEQIVLIIAECLNLAAKVFLLFILKKFLVYLFSLLVVQFVVNILIAVYLERKAPYLKKYKNAKVGKGLYRSLFIETKDIVLYNIAGKFVGYTDNMLISTLFGILDLGYLANYRLLINYIQRFVSKIVNPISAAIGSFVASSDGHKTKELLYRLDFVNYCMIGFCSLELALLSDRFILWWLGEKYSYTMWPFLICVLNFYLGYMNTNLSQVYMVAGCYKKIKIIPLGDIVINLVASIVLARYIGVTGVFAGTLFYYLYVVVSRSAVLFKGYLGQSCIHYLLRRLGYLEVVIACFAISKFFMDCLTKLNFFAYTAVALMGSTMLFLGVTSLLYHRTEEFQYLLTLIKAGAKQVVKSRGKQSK